VRTIRLLDSSAFRLALLYMSIFGLSVMLLLGFIYWTTSLFMEQQTMETIDAEIQGLSEQYRHLGLGGLIGVINQRIARDPSGRSIYLLTDSRFKPLVGNLEQWPKEASPEESWFQFVLSDESGEIRTALARRFLLVGNFHMLVGRDVSEKNAIQKKIIESLGWGLAMTIVLGLLGGVLMSRSILRRIDLINRTSREIMGGDLSRRMPLNDTSDEFDQLAQNLNDMLDQIEQLMTGIRQVSDNIAHDLRTPLNRLRTRIEVTLIESPDMASYRKVMEQTIAEADELLKTFNALLTIAQAEAGSSKGDFGAVDLRTLARDVAELYEPLAEEKGLSFEVKLRQVPPVQGNRHLLAQALANVLDNAIKYTPPGGRVSLELRLEGSSVVVSVSDDGPGIPRGERERVLERFYRLEMSRCTPGSGLGLSLVSAVTKLHKARLLLRERNPGSETPGLEVMLAFNAGVRAERAPALKRKPRVIGSARAG
jgi:signal transduction histidine kinase